jgi:hypothetical protein
VRRDHGDIGLSLERHFACDALVGFDRADEAVRPREPCARERALGQPEVGEVYVVVVITNSGPLRPVSARSFPAIAVKPLSIVERFKE